MDLEAKQVYTSVYVFVGQGRGRGNVCVCTAHIYAGYVGEECLCACMCIRVCMYLRGDVGIHVGGLWVCVHSRELCKYSAWDGHGNMEGCVCRICEGVWV